MHAIVLAFVFGAARYYGHDFYRHLLYTVKRLVSSMTDLLRFPPTVGPFFMNRECHENRESFGDASHSPLYCLQRSTLF